jgi:hypothetical protein
VENAMPLEHHLRLRPLVVAVLLGIIFAACERSPAAPDTDPLPLAEQSLRSGETARRVATLQPSTLTVPRSARIGEPVSAVVITLGGGCIRDDTTVVNVADLRATIVPYQTVYTPRENEGCTSELRITPRNIPLTFNTAGTAQVVILGREGSAGSIIRITRAVLVQ